MRDPKRIPEIVRLLECVWFQHPDLRLGQLVEFVASSVNKTVDPFFVEDDSYLDGMKGLLTGAQ